MISDAEIELAALCFGGTLDWRVEQLRVWGEVFGVDLLAGRDDLGLSYANLQDLVARALSIDVEDLHASRHRFSWAGELIELFEHIDADTLLARLNGLDAKARGAVLARAEQAIMRRSEETDS